MDLFYFLLTAKSYWRTRKRTDKLKLCWKSAMDIKPREHIFCFGLFVFVLTKKRFHCFISLQFKVPSFQSRVHSWKTKAVGTEIWVKNTSGSSRCGMAVGLILSSIY